MQLDRTWTLTFDEKEQDRIKAEVTSLELPTDLGRPILLKVIGASQITLPTRAVERILIELDFARSHYLSVHRSLIDYRRKYPLIESLYEELNAILNIPRRRSA